MPGLDLAHVITLVERKIGSSSSRETKVNFKPFRTGAA